MPLTGPLPPRTLDLGRFHIAWSPSHPGGARLAVLDGPGGRALWESVPGAPFVAASRGEARVTESRGFFRIDDRRLPFTDAQTLESMEAEGEAVVLRGQLSGSVSCGWQMTLSVIDGERLAMDVSLAPEVGDLPRVMLRHARADDERFFGFGEQFTHLDLRGHEITVLSQEPGIGRGVQPLTWVMETFFKAGGGPTRSNAPAPHYLTSALRSLYLEGYALSRFDLRGPGRVEIEVFGGALQARILRGDTPAALVEAYTRFSGRMAPLPDWIQRGAVVGMQGGAAAVEAMERKLREAGAPIAAFWLQDWVGARKTAIGSQLWWNWELDEARYPGWDAIRARLATEGTRLMSYVNPFLVDTSERGTPPKRDLFREAMEAGYLVKRADGSPYLVQNTSFSAAMVDLTNSAAWGWLKDVLRDQVLGAGVSGWMADFGEALPFDAVLHDGSDAALYHNRYPEAWARLNREVIREAGLDGEAVFFVRSGFSRSPGEATLFWLGDQLTSWTAEDGIRSALTGLLSSGLSGFSQNHSDVGGYTATGLPGLPFGVPLIDFYRGAELHHRWIELNAFTAVFRTHEGNRPDRNHQIDHDAETLAHFARFARIFADLAPLRGRLGREAAERGLPVVRHPWLSFPDDPATVGLTDQFTLGPSLMVAPVLDPGRDAVDVYLPRGTWRHLWGDAQIASEGGWFQASAPPGFPAVFFLDGDPDGAALIEALDARGDRAHPGITFAVTSAAPPRR